MKKHPIFMFLAASIMCGCEPEPEIITQNTPIRSIVEAGFRLGIDSSSQEHALTFAVGTNPEIVKTAPFVAAATKADAVTLHNVWVFQFSSVGLMFTAQKIGDIVAGSNISASFTTGLNQIIYIVANAAESVDFTKVTDLSSFETMQLSIASIVSEETVPLVGCVRGVDIVNENGKGVLSVAEGDVEVAVKKVTSKVVLNYTFAVEGYTLKSVSLVDAPAVATFVEPQADGASTFFPEAIVDANFRNVEVEITTEEQKGAGTLEWFTSDNIRGAIAEYTSPEQKNKDNAPVRSTYLDFAAKSDTENKILHYKLYLGEDECGNFNVYRNNTYNVTVAIDDNGTTIDKRIDVEIPPIIIIKNYAAPANSYVVAPGDEVMIALYRTVDDAENPFMKEKNVASVGVVWQTKDGDNLVLDAAAPVTLTIDNNETVMIVKTNAAASATGGNALVAAKDADGNILWSWHIWVTPYNPEETNYAYNNEVWMTRSLGALAANKEDSMTEGWLYQWGRKDPFPPSIDGIKNTVKLYDAAGALLPNVDTAEGDTQIAKQPVGTDDSNLEYSISHPSTFIYNSAGASSTKTAPIHWITSNNTSDAITAALWSATAKTIYDPCPAGWQVPSSGVYPATMKHNSLSYTAGASTYFAEQNGVYVNLSSAGLDNTSVWVKFQGFRRGTNNGTVVAYGDVATVWTTLSHADALRTWAIKIRAADYRTMIDYPRSEGMQVRCIKIAE